MQIPAFLFAKIIYCNRSKLNNDLADDEIVCPSVADRLADVWIILLWPFFVVPCGLITGYVAAKLSNTPKSQIGSCLVSCAFGNSTGLVLTLLTVIHDQFEATTELGSVDATAFLSVYLLLYPVLQWGVGGWLMAGEEEEHDTDSVVKGLSQTVQLGNLSSGQPVQNTFDVTMFPRSKSERIKSNGTRHRTAKSVHIPHLLNNEHFQDTSAANVAGEEEFGGVAPVRIIFNKNDEEHRDFLSSARIDLSGSGLATMIKELSFVDLCMEGDSKRNSNASLDAVGDSSAIVNSPPTVHESTPLLQSGANEFASNGFSDTVGSLASKEEMKAIQESDLLPLTETLLRVAAKVFQP